MNISSALHKSYDILINKSKTYKLDSEILLANVLKKNRIELLINKNKVLSNEEIYLFFKKIRQREKLKPISKIINKQSFWNFDIDVSKKTLIPRPETEILVDMVCNKFKNKKKFKFFDIGCGTGCISVSLLDIFKGTNCVSLDISKEAIINTKINLKKYNFINRAKIIQKNIFKYKNKEKFDLIISNPPYLRLSEYTNIDRSIKIYEPKTALIADNKDGTIFFENIILKLKVNLKLNGYVAFEIGDNQFNKLSKILTLNGFKIEAKYELINRQIRCLLAKKIQNYTLQ